MNRAWLLFFSRCNQCSCSVLVPHPVPLKNTGSFHTSSCMRRDIILTVAFKWRRLVHVTYLRVRIAMHSICWKRHKTLHCPVGLSVKQQTAWPRGVISTATESDLFRQITSVTLRFWKQTAGLNGIPFVFAFLIEAQHHLNLCLTAFFALILGRHRCG